MRFLRSACSRSVARCLAGGGIALLTLLGLAGEARADKVLVFQTKNNDPQGGDQAGPEAEAVFQGLGHDVTLVADFSPTLPADLSVFDSVWIIQVPPIADTDQAKLIDYANAGGGLYLTGERSCCAALNASVQNITSNVLRSPFPTIGSAVIEGGDLFTPTAADPFGITTTPNVITEWKTQAAGVIPAGVDPSRAVFENAANKVGAALYPPEDFQHGGGCLFIAMDLTFWQPEVAPEQNLSSYVENIEQFLSTCADSDHDGLSDEAEDFWGTDPDDPDSDNDGLCDGYATVEGVCISGEHPADDWDEDGIIPPLDTDDDNDGIDTSFEVQVEQAYPDVDGDTIPTWNDHDSDNDNFYDEVEGTGDYDDDGVPAIVDADDYPQACSEDPDCGSATSGMICNLDVGGYCQPGCRGEGGNGCPTGQTCTSTDDTIGDCVGGGEGGGSAGGGSAEGGGSSQGGGSISAGGGDAGSGGATGVGAEEDGGDSCSCKTAGSSRDDFGKGAALALGIAMVGLRRRRSATFR